MLTASQLVGMTDNEMATYASGGYGPAKRAEMIALIRRLALAETQKANAKEQILDRVFGKRSELTADEKVWG